MTTDHTFMTSDHDGCLFEGLHNGWENAKKSKPKAEGLYQWCQEEMFGRHLARACRAHINDEKWCDHGKQLIEIWDKDNPEGLLQDLINRSNHSVSQHQLFMAWSHLRLTEICVAEGGDDLEQDLEALFSEISEERRGGPPFGRPFFQALARFLDPELDLIESQTSTFGDDADGSALFPLVLDEPSRKKPLVAQLQVQQLSTGNGEVFLHPGQAFMNLDEDFRSAFVSAQTLVGGLSSDTCVRIELLEDQWVEVLSGRSVGGALYLSLRSLLEDRDLEGGMVTSFALDDGRPPDGQCHKVGHLRGKAKKLSSQDEFGRFLISGRQGEDLDDDYDLEVLRARTVEEAWNHATGRIVDLRRYLKHVKAKAEKAGAHISQQVSDVHVQRDEHRPTCASEEPDSGEGAEMHFQDSSIFGSELKREIILGDPGIGKSWLLHKEAMTIAQGALDQLEASSRPEEVRIPIYFRLSDLAEVISEKNCSLRKAVAKRFRGKEIQPVVLSGSLNRTDKSATEPSESLANLVEEKVGSGKVWLLLDALDEVPDENDQRSGLVDELRSFIETNPASRLLLTSRTADDTLSRVIDQNETEREPLQPFGDDQVKRFAERYFQEDERAKEFRSALEEDKALREMAEVPLLLSLICRSYEKEEHPTFLNREGVYERIVRGVLRAGWRRSRRSGISRDDLDDRLNELSAMAFSLKVSGKSEVPAEDLRRAIKFGYKKVYSEKMSTKRAKNRKAKYTREVGVISVKDEKYEKNGRKYKFIHSTIQDYLSVRWIGKNIYSEGIESGIEDMDGSIHNVKSIVAKSLKYSRSPDQEPVLKQEHIPLLVEILEDPDPLLELLTAHSKSDDEDVREALPVVLGRAASVSGKVNGYNLKVVRALCDQLSDREWSIRKDAAEALGKIKTTQSEAVSGLTDRLFDSEKNVRQTASDSLRGIGEINPEVVEEILISRLGSGNVYSEEAETHEFEQTGNPGPGVAQILTGWLEDQSPGVREAGARALGEIRVADPEVIKALNDRVRDEDIDVCKAAAEALARSGTEGKKILTERLAHMVPNVRRIAAHAFREVGISATEVLTGWLKDGDPAMRETAAQAFGKIEASSSKEVSALGSRQVSALGSKDVRTLGSEEVTALTRQLRDENRKARKAAAETLRQVRAIDPEEVEETFFTEGTFRASEETGRKFRAFIGTVLPDSDAVEVFGERLADEGPDAVENVMEALGKTDSLEPMVSKFLNVFLEDEFWRLRVAAARALGSIRASELEVVTALADRLEDKDSMVVRATKQALEQILDFNPEVTWALIDYSGDDDTATRKNVLRVLEKTVREGTQGSSSEIAEVLVHQLKDEKVSVRETAARALQRIEKSNPEAVETFTDQQETIRGLIELLDDENTKVREVATQMLEGAEVYDPEVVEALIEQLEDKNTRVRKIAAQVLGKVEVHNPEVLRVVEALTDRLEDKNTGVRKTAVIELDRLRAKGGGSDQFEHEVPVAPEIAARALERAAALVLERNGTEAGTVESIIDHSKSESAAIRKTAVRMLGKTEASAPEVVEALIGRLVDGDFCVRRAATRALGRIVSSDSEVAWALIKCVEGGGTAVREAAARALGKMRKSGQMVYDKTVEALSGRLEDANADVRRAAVEALAEIGESGTRSGK